MITAKDNEQIHKRKTGYYLMMAFLVGWIVVTIILQFYQAHVMGFGSGFGDGGHVPAAIAHQLASGSSAADAVAATSHNAPPMSVFEESWRIIFSLGVLAGISYFWYLVMSRIGTF